MSSHQSVRAASSLLPLAAANSPWQLCVAPMIDVTDRHCRFFHRQLAPHARLYTEMIATGALLHGQPDHHLQFNELEHPVALQLGGSVPDELARAARLGEQWGYDEINLNCGCPSARVQRGAFGACLMAQPTLVAACVRAMLDAISVPVTVKHRLGLDDNTDYAPLRDFVGELFDAGVRQFIVHARNAVLGGLSPKENRQIPPLRYAVAAQLKTDFPEATFVLNGGITEASQAQALLKQFDGVMLGRAAWHAPAVLGQLHRLLWPDASTASPEEVILAMADYARAEQARGTPARFITRAMLGWPSGQVGARQWRRLLSDAHALQRHGADIIEMAWEQLQNRQAQAAQATEPI